MIERPGVDADFWSGLFFGALIVGIVYAVATAMVWWLS